MALDLGGYSIALDAREPYATMNFISHAHSDHTQGARVNIKAIASEETKALVEARMGVMLDTVRLPQGVEMLDSGHILGSKQLYIDSEDYGSLVYTGDYQMQRSPVAKEIEIKEADIAILDSTYPYPKIKFDEREEVIGAMHSYVKSRVQNSIVVFGVYALGKAQEIVSVLNQIGLEPAVSRNIAKLNAVYQKFGVDLNYSSTIGEEKDFAKLAQDASVAVVETSRLDEVAIKIQGESNRKVLRGVATGFAKMFKFDTEVQFPLSDHADFAQTLEYLQGCKPKLVYTRGSGSRVFAHNLSKFGYNASPFDNGMRMNSVLLNHNKIDKI